MTFYAGQRPTADDFNKMSSGFVRVLLDGTQELANGAVTKVKYNHVVADDLGMWDEAGFRVVVPQGGEGVYVITASISYDAGVNGRRSVDIESQLQGRLTSTLLPATPQSNGRYSASTAAALEVGDSVWVTGYQTNGGHLDITSVNTNVTHFSMARVQPL